MLDVLTLILYLKNVQKNICTPISASHNSNCHGYDHFVALQNHKKYNSWSSLVCFLSLFLAFFSWWVAYWWQKACFFAFASFVLSILKKYFVFWHAPGTIYELTGKLAEYFKFGLQWGGVWAAKLWVYIYSNIIIK